MVDGCALPCSKLAKRLEIKRRFTSIAKANEIYKRRVRRKIDPPIWRALLAARLKTVQRLEKTALQCYRDKRIVELPHAFVHYLQDLSLVN